MRLNNSLWTKWIAGLALFGTILPSIGATGSADPAEAHGSQPPVRNIPGITAPDQFAMGCTDCHVYYPEMNLDARISTLMSGWAQVNSSNFMSRMKALAPKGFALKGRHPDVPSSFRDIPTACIKCHARPSTHAPSFGQMMHVIHLEGVRDGHFLSIFQGECTHCHKLEKNTGTWRVPSGPERAKPPVGAKDGAGVKKQAAGSNRAAAGEGLYMFCLIMSVCIGTFLCMGMIAVRAATDSHATAKNRAEH